MIYIMNKPPKVMFWMMHNFEAFVVGHFRNRVVDILMLIGMAWRKPGVGWVTWRRAASQWSSRIKFIYAYVTL
ncbi:hypothetical protein Hanom_Chr01g00045741 [Helianthus anomalus]